MAGSPVAVLFTTDGVEIPLKNSTTIPADARGVMLVGKDGTTSRFLLVDSTGNLKTVMDQLPPSLVSSRLDVNAGAWLGSTAPTVGQKAMASSIPVTLASDQPALTVGQGTAAALSGYWPVRVTDGTNTMPMMDTASRAGFHRITDGTTNATVTAASTAAVASDTGLVVSLSPNSPAKIWDGTNTAAVKAASTAAVASDPALVVAVSPNNPVKVWDGTNTAEILPASTAATATDTPLVVALHPSSPIKGTIQPKYGTANQSVTITLASLASSATAARASTVIDNSTTLFEDVLFFINFQTVASTSTTGYLNVYAYSSVDGGTTYSGGATGSDAALTIRNPTELVLLVSLPANTASAQYRAGPFSFCRLYGLDRLPSRFGFVVANVSGQALSATAANNTIIYQGVNGNFV